jgi:hypothetical protein
VTVAEERDCVFAARYPEFGGERGTGLLAQAVFFVLTACGVAAFYELVEWPIPAALAAIALAEYLIWRRGWFHTGVEAALWIGGLLCALQALPDTGAPEANLLLALAFGIAGARVRQPLFGAAAAYFVAAYLEARVDLGVIAALIIAAAALIALYREWKRPSNEWLFIVLLVAMPLAGWSFADREWLRATIALYALFAVLAFVSAVLVRHHGMFAGAASGAIVAGVKLHELLRPPGELSLAAAGALLLAGSLLISRALRGRTRVLVLTAAKPSEVEDGLEILGTLAAAPSAGNPPETRPQGDGRFGGAGATGDY